MLPLYRSDTQHAVLTTLFADPTREHTLSELARATGIAVSAIHKEVGRLAEAHLVHSHRRGTIRLISPNLDHPAAQHLTALLLLDSGPPPLVATHFGAIPGAERVLIFGSWAARAAGLDGPPPNDIDVLVVGGTDTDPLPRTALFLAARRVEAGLTLEVNPITCSPQRWAAPDGDRTISSIQSSPYYVVSPLDQTGLHA